MSANRTIKVIASASFILIAVAIFILRGSPATSFEPSIYVATPIAAWICLLSSIAAGIGIVVYYVYKRQTDSRLWLIGLALILFGITVIISIHILRGYELWFARGDPSSHVGYIKDIIATGHETHGDNFYPILHIYAAQLSLIFNINPILLAQWMPVAFTLLSMVFVYFVAKLLLPDKAQVLLTTIAGTALISGWYLNLTPNHLANLIFPMALYIMCRRFYTDALTWRLLFVILIFFMVPFHPVPSFALIIILSTIWIPYKLLGLFVPKDSMTDTGRLTFSFVDFSLFIIIFFTWLSSFYVWESLVKQVRHILLGIGSTYASELLSDVGYATSLGYNLFIYFIKTYSGILVILFLAGAGLILLCRTLKKKRKIPKLLSVYGPIAFIGMIIIALFNFRIFNPMRLATYVTMLSTFCAGFTLAEFIKMASSRSNRRGFAATLITALLLFGISVQGISIVYSSSYTYSISGHTTSSEIAGMDSFFHWRDSNITISSMSVVPYRLGDLLIGYGQVSKEPASVPYHFGYNENATLGQLYSSDSYLILTDRDRKLYTEVYHELAEIRFSQQDFKDLELDTNVDKLYSNGGFDLYYIHGLAAAEK